MGESRLLELKPATDKATGRPLYTLVCFEGASPLRLGLLWSHAELNFTAEADQAYFDFEAASGDARPALLHTLLGLALPAERGAPLAHVHSASPYGSSCVGVRAVSGAQALRVRAERRFVWWLPVQLLAGLALVARAGALSESRAFYYAGGSTAAVVLGVLIVALFVLRRCFERRWQRALASAALLTGYIGSLSDTLARSLEGLARRHPDAVLCYAAVCGAAGLVFVHRALTSASAVPVWLRDVARWSMWLLGGALVLTSTYSRAAVAVGATLCALAAAALVAVPAELRAVLWARYFESKPAPRPETTFLAGGAFLSEEQYRAQAEIETDRALTELHASPGFQKWLLANHRRVRLSAADQGGEQS
ncbi:hypothetical protein T492DRAFT_1098436 [Pavlovales sp. CCMP2436]|nr:hypothetical protein T492DRAFT_1098436 [Pavlovales sp. CCMP2436]